MAEDESIVRLMAVEYLSAAGFEVLEAQNADEAMTIMGAQPLIDLVFSDINMPGTLDGEELANWLTAYRPRLPIILTSGAVRPVIDSSCQRRFIAKPYVLAELERQIRELLPL